MGSLMLLCRIFWCLRRGGETVELKMVSRDWRSVSAVLGKYRGVRGVKIP